MRLLSLFSGIGGMDLGLERAGFTVVGQCEIDPYCRAVLAKHWPDVPRFEDIRDIDPAALPDHDMQAGGFPCQDISSAGKGAGIHAERSGLWWEWLRLIRARRPARLLIENVPALRTRGADDVIAGLESLGYACRPLVVGAWAVGAPHRRDRVWIVGRLANADNAARAGELVSRRARDEAAEPWASSGGSVDELANSSSRRCERRTVSIQQRRPQQADSDPEWTGEGASIGGDGMANTISLPSGRGPSLAGRGPGERTAPRWPSGPGERQHDWERPRLVESSVGVATDGLPRRVVGLARRNALRALGNAVVPQVVEAIGRAILAAQEPRP